MKGAKSPASALFDQAQRLRKAGKRDEALVLCRQVLELDPRHVLANRWLGAAARSREEHAAALAHFSAVFATNPQLLGNRFDMAAELRALGRNEEADAVCLAIIEEEPSHAPARSVMGFSAREKGDHEQALAHFLVARTSEPENAQAIAEYIRQLLILGRAEEATQACEALLKLEPSNFQAHRWLGSAARARKDHAAALAYFKAACRIKPRHVESHLDCATELRRLGRFDEASEACQAVLVFDPKNVQAIRGLALSERQRGDHEAELRQIERAIVHAPGLASLKVSRARALGALRRFDEAEAGFRALGLKNASARQGLMETVLARGDRSRLLAFMDDFIDVLIPDWAVWSDIGRALRRGSGWGDEAVFLRRGAVFFAVNPHYWLQLATAERQAMQSPAALKALDAALQHGGHDAPLLMRIAEEAEVQKVPDRALAAYDRALVCASDKAEIRLRLARFLRGIGNGAAAIEALRALLRDAPGHETGLVEYLNLLRISGALSEAWTFVCDTIDREAILSTAVLNEVFSIACARQDYPSARELAARRKAQFPEAVDALLLETQLARQMGNEKTFRSTIAEILQRDPGNREAIAHLQWFADALNDHEEVNAILKQQVKSGRSAPLTVGLALARNQFQSGDFEAADETIARIERDSGASPSLSALRTQFAQRRGEIFVALQTAIDGLQAFPSSWDLREREIRLLIYLGRYERALERLECLEPTSQREQEKRAFLSALILGQRREFKQALSFMEMFVSKPNRGNEYYQLSATYRLQCLDLEAAREDLKQMMELMRPARIMRGQSVNISQSMLGQLLNEYSLDPEILEKIRTVDPRAIDDAALAKLGGIAADNPDSVLAAVTFLLRMRQAGRLEPSSEMPDDPRIPASIIQFWDSELPPCDLVPLMESWRAHHPGWQYRLFNRRNAMAFLKANFPPSIVAAFDRAKPAARAADIFRLAILAVEGGIYADSDDRCLHSLEDVRHYHFFGYQEDVASLGNNVIGAIPGHPIVLRALDLAVEAVLRGDTEIAWLSSGPGVLTRAAVAWLVAGDMPLAEKLRSLRIMERAEARNLFSSHCHAAYKTTDKHWSKKVFT